MFPLFTVEFERSDLTKLCQSNAKVELTDSNPDTKLIIKSKFFHFKIKSLNKFQMFKIIGKNLKLDVKQIIVYTETNEICKITDDFVFICPLTKSVDFKIINSLLYKKLLLQDVIVVQ